MKYIIVFMGLLALVGCGSDPQPNMPNEQAGSSPIVEDAANAVEPDASAEGGEGGEKGIHAVDTLGDAGLGGVPSITEDAGSPEGGEGGAVPVDARCPEGIWKMCDVGYGFACQMDLGYGQHYQFACNSYCDDDDSWGVIDPEQQSRCEAAGGTCTCLGIDLDGGACPNRYECQVSR